MKHGKWFCAILALVTLLTLAAPALARGEIWQKGDTGEKVLEIQARLKELGYLEDETPGAFDEKTENAVTAFQRRNGLLATGMVDASTWTVLFSDGAAGAVSANSGPWEACT